MDLRMLSNSPSLHIMEKGGEGYVTGNGLLILAVRVYLDPHHLLNTRNK